MIAFIINPISGGIRPDAARERAELAASILDRHGNPAEVFITERPGHARELTKAGYSATEEFPIFLLLFGVPAIVAVVVKWKFL